MSHTRILHFDMDLRQAWHGMPAMSYALKLANARRAEQKLGPLQRPLFS